MNPGDLTSPADRQHALRAETAGKRKRTPEERRALEERESELYKRMEKLSRLPLEGNKVPWDEFVLEIGGARYYEHLSLLVAIVKKGRWRINPPSNLKSWLLAAWRNQVGKIQEDDDYDEFGKRRPAWPKFDTRNGALIRHVVLPFAEFTMSDRQGRVTSGAAAIELMVDLPDDDAPPVRAADRGDLRFLGGLTRAERYEHDTYEKMLHALKHQRPIFDAELKAVILRQQPLVQKLRLDPDEARVIAVMTILWAGEARTYLNFLEGAEKR